MSVDNIKVAIKARPLLKKEKDSKLSFQWKIKDNSIQLVDSQSDPFHFDHIFDENATNQELFDLVAKPIVDATLRGFNGTIFAYGQTSSGKTYTMLGDSDDNNSGVIVLAAKEIFKEIQSATDRAFLLRVGYIEIYNEKIYDLLDKKNDLKIHEPTNGEVNVNCAEFIITCEAQIMEYLQAGNKIRKIGETNMNERSSRSHAIFRIIIESREINKTMDDDAVQISYLNLVDLAGSERADQTGATGFRLKEGGHINRSLLSLSLVIKQLSENESDKFINYRNSKLTRILQASLGGNALTAIICTIKPTAIEETYSTLSFALRAKSIKNKPKVNEILSDAAMMKRLEKEIVRLEKELELERQRNGHIKVLELENKIKEEELKIVRSNYVGVKIKDRRKTWCPMSTISEETQKILNTRRESDISPVKAPMFLTPLVTTHREFIEGISPPFPMVDDELFPMQNSGIFKNEDRDSTTPEKDLESRYKALEQELEELKTFTDLERKLDISYDTLSSLNKKLEEVQKEKMLYEQGRFQLSILQDQLYEKDINLQRFQNRCAELQDCVTKLEEKINKFGELDMEYKRKLDDLTEKNKHLEITIHDAESFQYMHEQNLKVAKNRENDLLALLKEKDAQITSLERQIRNNTPNDLTEKLINKNIVTDNEKLQACDNFGVVKRVCVTCVNPSYQEIMENYEKVLEENNLLKTEISLLRESVENKSTVEEELKKLAENYALSIEKVHSLQEEVQNARTKIASLQNEYDELSSELMESIQENDEYKTKCSKYEINTQDLEERIKCFEQKISSQKHKSCESDKFFCELQLILNECERIDLKNDVNNQCSIKESSDGQLYFDDNSNVDRNILLDKIKLLKSKVQDGTLEKVHIENQMLRNEILDLKIQLKDNEESYKTQLIKLNDEIFRLVNIIPCSNINDPADLEDFAKIKYVINTILTQVKCKQDTCEVGITAKIDAKHNCVQTEIDQKECFYANKLDTVCEQTKMLKYDILNLCNFEESFIQKVAELENILFDLETKTNNKMQKLVQEKSKINNEVLGLKDEIASKEELISKLEKESISLKEHTESLKKENSELIEKYNDTCFKLESINKSNECKKCSQLELELKQVSGNILEISATSKQHMEEVYKLNTNLEENCNKIKILQEQLEEKLMLIDNISKEMTEKSSQINELEKELIDTKNKYILLENEMKLVVDSKNEIENINKTLEQQTESLNEQIHLKDEKIDKLEKENLEKSNSMKKLNNEVYNLNSKISDLEHTLEDIKIKYIQTQDDNVCSTYKSQIIELERKLLDSTLSLENLSKIATEKGLSICNLESDLNNARKKFINLENELRDAISIKDVLKSINDKLVDENLNLKKDFERLKQEYDQKSAFIKDLTEKINEMNSQLSDLERTLQITEEKYNQLQKDNESLIVYKDKILSFEEEIHEKSTSIEAMNKQMTEKALRTADLERDLEYIRIKCIQLEEELKYTLTSRDQILEANKRFEEQISELNNCAKQKYDEFSQLEKENSEKTDLITNLRNEIDVLNSKLAEIELSLTEAKARCMELEEENENIPKYKSRLEDLEKDFNEKTESITSITDKLREKCFELSELENKFVHLDNKLKEELAQKDAALQTNQKLADEIENLKNCLHAKTKDLNELELKYNEKNNSSHYLENEVNKLKTKLIELESNLENIQAKCTELETENESNIAYKKQFQCDNNKLNEDISHLKEEYNDLIFKFEKSVLELKEMENEKVKLEENVQYLTEQKKEAVKNLQLFSAEKIELETLLNNKIYTLQSEIKRCQTDKQNLEEKIILLEAELTNINSKNLILLNKIELLETEKNEIKKLLAETLKQNSRIENGPCTRRKADGSEYDKENLLTVVQLDNSHQNKVKVQSPTNEDVRKYTQKDRKTRRQSKYDEKRQSLWDNTRDIGTMTCPTDKFCSCEELNAKLNELKKAIRIKECQINTLILEIRNNPLKEENKELKNMITEEVAEKNRLQAEIAKIKTLSLSLQNNVCFKCSRKSGRTYFHQSSQTDPSIEVKSQFEDNSDSKLECDGKAAELIKLQNKNNDLKKLCRFRLARIQELEGRSKKEKENEFHNEGNPNYSSPKQMKTLQSSLDSLKKELQYVTKKYEMCKAVCISRGEEVAQLEQQIKQYKNS